MFICEICDKEFINSTNASAKCSNCEISEMPWRNKISSEIKNAIDSNSEINAYGAYLIARGHNE